MEIGFQTVWQHRLLAQHKGWSASANVTVDENPSAKGRPPEKKDCPPEKKG
jgi:hypothetical protein